MDSDRGKPQALSGTPSGPLKGLRVVDLSINMLGPLATQTLGDMGAEVVKVETRTGDPNRYMPGGRHHGMAPLFMSANRSKKSLVLDLKDPQGLEALMRLVETADVFVHSMRTGAAQRLGISYEAIAARRPDIVYACGMGYSPDGPYADRPAYDDVIQGESGFVDLQRKAYGQAAYVPTVIVDKVCALTFLSAILMAIIHRQSTGEGQQVNVPMLETAASFVLVEHIWAGSFQREGPWCYPRMIARTRRPFPTSDGHVCLLATHDDEWRRVWTALGRPEHLEDPRFATLALRTRNLDALYGLLGAELARLTTADAVGRLQAHGVACGKVNAIEELQDDPHLKATGFFRTYDHPTEGPTRTTAIPVRMSRTPGELALHPPGLGEHSAELLAELGYGADEIERLSAPGTPPAPPA